MVPTASHFWDVADIPEWNGIPNKNSTNNNNNKRDATPHKDYGCSSLTILAGILFNFSPSPSSPPSSPLVYHIFCIIIIYSFIYLDMECGPAILEYDSIMAVHFSITEIYSHTVYALLSPHPSSRSPLYPLLPIVSLSPFLPPSPSCFSLLTNYLHRHILQNYISTKLDIMMNFGNQTYPSHRLYRKLTAVGK